MRQPTLCDVCGQAVGHCDPACPYHGVVFIDEFLHRRGRMRSGHPSVRGALAGVGAEKQTPPLPAVMQVIDLETFRKKKKEAQIDDKDKT